MSEVKYKYDKHGVIHQDGEIKPPTYDQDYVAYYNRLGIRAAAMAIQRLGYVTLHCRQPKTLLDVGYGNGDFLKMCAHSGMDVLGYDVSGVSLEEWGIKTTTD